MSNGRGDESFSRYETFDRFYNRAKQMTTQALEIDEKNDSTKTGQAMRLYRSAVSEYEKGLKISVDDCPTEKRTEVKRHQMAMKKHLVQVKERIIELEKRQNPSSKRPSPSRNTVAKTNRPLARSSSSDTQTDYKGKQKVNMLEQCNGLSRAEMLRGVDEKLGGALLDEMLMNDVSSTNSVHMNDVQGLFSAKQALEEAVILPALNPKLFSGLRQPVRGILLFGPPGTGKTMLARAVATEAKSTFFNLSAASLTSKWVGDAEKTVRALFRIARNAQPAILFIDEIDSVLCERNDKESDASRRLKTEFLLQFDGMTSSDTDRVLVMGATNRPHELDDAVLRRFTKRIMLDLPDHETRSQLIKALLEKNGINSIPANGIKAIANQTVGYSSADIVAALREAAMIPVRELTCRTKIAALRPDQLRPLSCADIEASLRTVRPTTNEEHCRAMKLFADRCGTIA